ncbi:MAG: RluA family pseudouridine synthase [Oscillospiraceae bacterium]
MREIEYIIEDKFNSMRIVDFLKNIHGYSSRSITKLKQNYDAILLNGVHARAIDIMNVGDTLRLKFYEQDRPYIETNLTCDIVFEDEDIIAYNKPPFMPCHTSRGHIDDTLANVYATYCRKKGIEAVFRPLNRLDKDTSGIVICAKNQYTASKITGGFDKTYTAIVCGNLHEYTGTVNEPIIRENDMELKRIVSPDGQTAITHYKVVARANGYDLVDFKLETGRTHQIRVHMSHIGHPLLGDTMYGEPSEQIPRQALHCRETTFIHPMTNQVVVLSADMHIDIKNVLEKLNFKQCV